MHRENLRTGRRREGKQLNNIIQFNLINITDDIKIKQDNDCKNIEERVNNTIATSYLSFPLLILKMHHL